MRILQKQAVSTETANQLTQRRSEGRTRTELLGKLGIAIGEPTQQQLFMHTQAADDPSIDIAEDF